MNKPAAPRTLALCADDFGTSPGISQAISGLVLQGRLQAVSCLATHAHWPSSAPLIDGWPASADVGLHFNLTEGAPLGAALREHWPVFPSLPSLIMDAHLRRLPLAAIDAELQAQLDAFVAARGAPPDFIDGHQHVHALPGVRRLVLDAARASARDGGAQHRPRPRPRLRRQAAADRADRRRRAAARRCAACSVPHNAALLGVYDFSPSADYRALMRGWLDAVPPEGALLFCHPGAADADSDPIAEARPREAAYLGSDEFERDLRGAGVVLGQVWQQQDPGGPA